MNNNAGYQPAEQTTVVVVPHNRLRGPSYLQQGVRVGGLALGLSCIACLAMFGIFFLLSGTIMLATADYDDDFWEEFDRDFDPVVIVGSIFLVIGFILVAACVGVCIYARKKYKDFDGQGLANPGRVINPNLGGYPGQPQTFGYPGQPHQTGYMQPQPYGYPGQPQPAAYPQQPLVSPEATALYPASPAPYPQQPVVYAAQPDPSYPEKPGKTTVTNVTSEYVLPPPTVPGTFDAPSAPSSDPPPYRP